MFPELRPELIAIARDALNCSLEHAASIAQAEGASVLPIDQGSALAVWGETGKVMRDGRQPDYRRPHPLHLAFNQLGSPLSTFPLRGAFPSSRFFVAFVFPNREEPFRMVSWCSMEEPQPLRLRLHTRHDLGDVFGEIKESFLEWLHEATTSGFHGETLVASLDSIERYSEPARFPFPRQLGWEIIMPQANEVFFPWLELFFQLRRQLPKAKRVSFDFSHPPL
jgi:hypothetical protein